MAGKDTIMDFVLVQVVCPTTLRQPLKINFPLRELKEEGEDTLYTCSRISSE